MKKYIFISTIFVLSVFIACGSDDSDSTNPTVEVDSEVDNGVEFNISEHIENIYDNGIIQQTDILITEAKEFQILVQNFKGETSEANFEVVQNAWKSLILQWKPLEVLTVGTSIALTSQISSIDFWPIETEIIDNSIQQNEDAVELSTIQIAGDRGKGLAALEYLLFGEDITSFIDGEFAENKINYVNALAEDLVIEIEEYKRIQLEREEIFKTSLSNSVTGTQNQLVNSMIFRIDEISTFQIGTAVGADTDGTIDSSLTEASYSEFSLEIIEKEIQQIENIFTGLYTEDAIENGIYAQLSSIGRQDLITELVASFEDVYSKIDSFDLNLEQQLNTGDATLAFTLVDAVTKLEILIKNDVSSALNVVITFGDNDGD